MSSLSKTNHAPRALGAVLALGTFVGGCSDIYYDRRETVALGANDAVESNKVTQMIDPWPPYSANRNIAFNGQRLQGAVERYRHHEVIKPVSPGTSNLATQQIPTQTEALPAGSSTTTQSNSNTVANPNGTASNTNSTTTTTTPPVR
jgi:hypothetical protein